MKQLYLIFSFLVLSAGVLLAQPLASAPKLPKQKVKQITEWIRFDFEQKAKEGAISNFDKNGNLISYHDKSETYKKLSSKFDSKGRLLEKTEWFDNDQMITYFAYKKNLRIEETKFRGKTYKTFFYSNSKNQVIEKKSYAKGLELGDDFLLKERVIYHYNRKDSLSGEKIFSFDLLANGKTKNYDTRKVLYFYSAKTGMRSKKIEYDFDGSVISEAFFDYDQRKRLIKSINHFKLENTLVSTEIKYKNGKIWQSTTERPGYKDVKIYVDGRLIRLRSYNEDKIIRIVDYQYDYY